MNIYKNKYKSEVDSVSESKWSSLIKQFDDANIYQTWSYGKVACSKNNFSHLLIKDKNDNVVCMAQLAITKLPLLNAGIATLNWGPIWRLSEKEYDLNLFDIAIKALRDEYVKKRRLNLRVYPYLYNNDKDAAQLHNALLAQGFQHSETSYTTFLIDLTPDLDQLRKDLIPRWRTDLNRSERNNLEIVEGTDIELYDEFLEIYDEMHEKKNFLSFADPRFYKKIQQLLPNDLKINILISKSSGAPVSAALTSHLGNTGLGVFWASNMLGRNLRAAYHLQWKTIEKLKMNGCSFYDIGGIDLKTNPGSFRFKSGLAGKNGVEVKLTGRYDTCESVLSKMFIKFGEQLKIILRKTKILFHNAHKIIIKMNFKK